MYYVTYNLFYCVYTLPATMMLENHQQFPIPSCNYEFYTRVYHVIILPFKYIFPTFQLCHKNHHSGQIGIQYLIYVTR